MNGCRAIAWAILVLAATARAQLINRAAWLGTDDEGVRRDFAQGTEYYLDRASYVLSPPWWQPDLERFHTAPAGELAFRLDERHAVRGRG